MCQLVCHARMSQGELFVFLYKQVNVGTYVQRGGDVSNKRNTPTSIIKQYVTHRRCISFCLLCRGILKTLSVELMNIPDRKSVV